MAYSYPPVGTVIGRHISKLKARTLGSSGRSRCDFKWRICRGVCLFRDLLRPTSRYFIPLASKDRLPRKISERSLILLITSILSFRRLLKVEGPDLMTSLND